MQYVIYYIAPSGHLPQYKLPSLTLQCLNLVIRTTVSVHKMMMTTTTTTTTTMTMTMIMIMIMIMMINDTLYRNRCLRIYSRGLYRERRIQERPFLRAEVRPTSRSGLLPDRRSCRHHLLPVSSISSSSSAPSSLIRGLLSSSSSLSSLYRVAVMW